ncbi:hypothetical protein, partial [Escherichia coli]|uniref:hypothetical protein n=1 Tax=Escherichia coli TaxID=562 RepID=UPI0013D8266E
LDDEESDCRYESSDDLKAAQGEGQQHASCGKPIKDQESQNSHHSQNLAGEERASNLSELPNDEKRADKKEEYDGTYG